MNKSKWHVSNRFIVILLIPFGVALLVTLLLPLLASGGKGVGNIGAQMTCHKFLRLAKAIAVTNEHRFEFSSGELDSMRSVYCRPRDAQFVVRTNFLVTKSSQEIVIACTNSYRNLTKPGLWAWLIREPLHAVGGADGKVKLISADEFKALDLAEFTSLNEFQGSASQSLHK